MINATAAGDIFRIPRGAVDHLGYLHCLQHATGTEDETPEYGHGIDRTAKCDKCGVVLYDSPEWRRRIRQAVAQRTNDGRVQF